MIAILKQDRVHGSVKLKQAIESALDLGARILPPFSAACRRERRVRLTTTAALVTNRRKANERLLRRSRKRGMLEILTILPSSKAIGLLL